MAIIGTGIDSIEIYRIQELIEKYGDRFLNRVYTEAEIKKCKSRTDFASCFAARFAVKEAVYKALPQNHKRDFSMKSVETINMQDGKPEIKLSGKLHNYLRESEKINIHVSLTHSRILAAAVVIIEKL